MDHHVVNLETDEEAYLESQITFTNNCIFILKYNIQWHCT